jgi:hypothetical protein
MAGAARDLVHEYGQTDEYYRRRVPMLVPSGGGTTVRQVTFQPPPLDVGARKP